MRKPIVFITLSILLCLTCHAPAQAQITTEDLLFSRLSTTTRRMAYEQGGGAMKEITPLLEEAGKSAATDALKAFRAYMKASVLMSGTKWTPDAELTTALDFSLNVKAVGAGERLQAYATFLFDAPAAANAPYRMELEILKSDNTKEATVEPGIVLGDIKGRRGGETIGLNFDPSKRVGPGVHLLRATLKDGQGAALFQYYRSFFIINDLNKRLAEAEKLMGLQADHRSQAALTAQYYLDAIRRAHQTYLGGSYQNLTGMLHTHYRSRNYGLSELMDFDAALDEATKLATALKAGRNPIAEARGDLKLVYRSSFDGKLVPYRLYIPTTYDKTKSYPMITLLHGAGGDENSFFNGYRSLWPKEAEARGYIIVAVNGRGPISGYGKANGGEQDVLDVTALVQQNYNIDPNRVYLAGHSMGAGGTWTVGLAYRDRFAALAPMAGTRPSAALETALKTGRKIPIIIVAGGKDPLVPVAGCREVAAQAKALGYEVKYLEYPDGDHSSPVISAVKDVFDWFDVHRKIALKE
jgi:predicted esterase